MHETVKRDSKCQQKWGDGERDGCTTKKNLQQSDLERPAAVSDPTEVVGIKSAGSSGGLLRTVVC